MAYAAGIATVIILTAASKQPVTGKVYAYETKPPAPTTKYVDPIWEATKEIRKYEKIKKEKERLEQERLAEIERVKREQERIEQERLAKEALAMALKKEQEIAESEKNAALNEKRAFKFFTENGITREGAASIIGNFYAESGMIPTRTQDGGGPGTGLAQWGYNMDGGRFNKLISYAKENGLNEWRLDTQLAYTLKELKEGGMFNTVANTKSVSFGATYFCNRFEAPNPAYAHIDKRIALSAAVLNRN